MLKVTKKLGETPLELIERLRREWPELGRETLSYAGRLDPMAEGQMIILVGEKENSPEKRAKFLGHDKEYVATFLVGVKTDSNDCLGIVQNNNNESTAPVSEKLILDDVERLIHIKTQTYPWFSGKTVNGIKLFDHFKAGKTDADIKRPSRTVEIKEVGLLDVCEHSVEEIETYIFDAIGKVSPSGDFRQQEIAAAWKEFFAALRLRAQKTTTFQTFEIRVVVSSGTFIRAFTEHFTFPTILLKLNRTKIL